MTKTFKMTRAMQIGTSMLKVMLRAGVPMGPLVLLAVRGRKSGTVYTTPVALVKQNGTRWLVAAFGKVNWVLNLRASGEAQFIHGHHTEPVGVVELGVTEAAPILQQFLKDFHRVPFIPPYFNVTQKSSLTDFEREALHHPVFRIVGTKAM